MFSRRNSSNRISNVRFQIVHRTAYKYVTPVRDSSNDIRLRPCSNEDQTVEFFALDVEPATNSSEYHDIFANAVHHFDQFEPHDTLVFESRLVMATHPREPLSFDAMPWPLERIDDAVRMARCYDFLHPSQYVDCEPETWRMAIDASASQFDVWQTSLALMRFVHGHLSYRPGATTAQTHMRDALIQRAGVCQDFAHVMIGLCRALRIPALYVSGYLATETASATHAWTEVYIPGAGWRGLDATHNRVTDANYVKIAVGRDYADVPPISGHYRGTRNRTMEVSVNVTKLSA